MANIEELIQDLQSDDLETRYNACKQLELEPQLTESAIKALQIATKDPDPLVSVSASRALEVHKSEVAAVAQKEDADIPIDVSDKDVQTSLSSFEKTVLIVGTLFTTAFSFIIMMSVAGSTIAPTNSESQIYWLVASILIVIAVLFFLFSYVNLWAHRAHWAINYLLCFLTGLSCGVVIPYNLSFLNWG